MPQDCSMYPGSSPQSSSQNPLNSSFVAAENSSAPAPGQFAPHRRQAQWPLPQYDPTVTAAVIDRIQAGHLEAVGAVSSTRTASVMASQGAPTSGAPAGRPFGGRLPGGDFVAFSTSDLAAINRLGNSGQPSGSGLAPIRPSGPQPPHSSAAREQEERFLDFQALLQDEQQQNTSQNGTLRDFSDSWRRVSVPPPNVNPFNDRARPSVIQMSPSVLPSGRLPLFHQRAAGGPDSRSDTSNRFHTDQMSPVNQHRSRMAAEEYIRSRERAPDAQLFPYTPFQRRVQLAPPHPAHRPYLPSEPGQFTRVPSMQLPVPSALWRGAAPVAPPMEETERRSQQEAQRLPPQHSPFVTVLHTNPGQPLPLQGPIRSSRIRQLPARQPPTLPLPTPLTGNEASVENGPSPAFWNTQNLPHYREARQDSAALRAHLSDPYSVSLTRDGDAFVVNGPAVSTSRAHIARNAASSPYARPLIATPDFILRRSTSSPAVPAERSSSLASEGSSSGMPPLDRDARMREIQLRIDAAAARDRDRLMETVNINGERMPVDLVFPTRVSRLAHHEHLRALHDNNAEQRRRLVYIPQGHHPSGAAHAAMAFGHGRFAASLMQFMDAGIFMSNEHGEPKLILEEDVISAIACDTTSFKFDSQFPATDECIICFEEFELQQDVRVLSCNHTHRFHKHCIDKWLIKNKPNCPICRQILPSLDPKKDITMPIIEAAAHSNAGPSHNGAGGGPFSSSDWTAIFDQNLRNSPRN